MRAPFATDPKRITAMLNNLLIAKTLAAEARAAGAERDPEVQRRLKLETDRFYAAVQIQRIEEAAAAEFDARRSQFLAKAQERYAIDKNNYRTPEQVSVAHILFENKVRGNDAALALARETRAKLLAGADFAALAKELSDDPSAKSNSGHLDWFSADRMDPAFSKAAFAMKSVGDISEPVLSRFGYHLIRFEGRRPAAQQSFDQVKELIMADLRKRYIDEKRETRMDAIRGDPAMKVNQPAVDSLVVQVKPEAFKATAPAPAK
jgi:peptidyl-prolyl cis-trans isomerase C